MIEEMINDLVSYNQKVLLIGYLSDFDQEIQILLRRYQLDVTQQPPENYHVKDYSVIIFSPSCLFVELSPRKNKRCFQLSFSKNILGDIQIVRPFSFQQFQTAFSAAIEFHQTKSSLRDIEKQHLIVSKERKNLSAIGVALSAEKDLNKLLGMVLKEGRGLGKCEGASLYLIEKNEAGENELVFKLTQNSKISFDFQEVRFPLTSGSLAGYVALNGEILNIEDVYHLAPELPYEFDKSFDTKVGYRSKELLVLPMKNHKGKTIGVLQFVNTFGKDDFELAEGNESGGFLLSKQGLLAGLASQAAVAIDNTHLIENIQNLFEGFVSASVNAIESRDPVTSGHSFRVAELTTGLAKMLDKETAGVHKNIRFNQEQLREIRYASLLHDFGKVGVKENVLLKANKLHASRFQYLELKIEWQKQMLEKRFYKQLLQQNKSFDPKLFQQKNILDLGINDSAFKALINELNQLEQYKKMLFKANQPSLLEEKIASELSHMADYKMDQEFPFSQRLISDSDFLSLSISKGSLTARERNEIQSHVVHTQEFLARIPWTEEFSAIPSIAGAHHEKLDGTGYPAGLTETQIPLPSKIMAIADIFDALTAQDRPYKKAIKYDIALDILQDEANNGKIDGAMLDTFIESKIYKCVL
ncbi:MAG: GAF domain-containing protein [Kangiellaceae bacterium]|nr:GAF domain-containing protein [Kangiellaceae bacterium]